MHLELCQAHSKVSILYIITTVKLTCMCVFPVLPPISREEAFQSILYSIHCHQLRLLRPLFSAGWFPSAISLISSLPGSASNFPSIYHPTSYFSFKAKML